MQIKAQVNREKIKQDFNKILQNVECLLFCAALFEFYPHGGDLKKILICILVKKKKYSKLMNKHSN